ncbi:MAG: hypothetical protein IJX26_04125, partial [Clostridia bacterium]|nr:hypothetical protein [Clostridia bacterium]
IKLGEIMIETISAKDLVKQFRNEENSIFESLNENGTEQNKSNTEKISVDILNKKEPYEDFEEQTAEKENFLKDVCVVLLNVDNEKFGTTTKAYNLKMLGKTMTEWVANSVFDAEIRTQEIGFKDDFLPVAKRLVNPEKKYTVVLFSDTPLFQRKTYLQIMDYFRFKGLSVLKLTRGYVFETEYLLQIENLLSPQTQYFEEEDFMMCYDLKHFSMVADILRNRILNYFMKNGVIIPDTSSVFVDADAQIGSDTVIESGCHIKGGTIIERNCIIGTNSIIENSIICENSVVKNSVVNRSFVGKNCVINENSKLENSKIQDEVAVPFCVSANGVVVSKDDKLCSFKSYVAEE